MANKYSEDQLIEQTCIEIFDNQLNWKIANVYQGETFGEAGTIGRNSEVDVILKRYFYQAIEKLNPNLPKQAYDLAYELIQSDDVTKNMADINLEKHTYSKERIPTYHTEYQA